MSNIEEELLEEVSSLRKELRKLTSNEKEVQSLSSFYTTDLDNKLKLSGILLAEGTWGGVYWDGKAIEEMVKKYKRKLNEMEITAEHERYPKWGTKRKGYHESVSYNDKLKAAIYEGIIDDSKAIKAIKDGTFRATSLRIKFVPKFENNIKIATKLEPINNTLTETPACKTCNIFTWKDLSNQENEIKYFGIKEKNISKDNERYSDVNTMSEETEFEDIEIEEADLMSKYFELKSDLVGVLPDETELDAKEGLIKLELMTEDEAIARGKTIIYYYPEGKYRNRARVLSRKKVQGEFGYYPLYRNGQPIPYSLLAKPVKIESEEEPTEEPEEKENVEESVTKVEKDTEEEPKEEETTQELNKEKESTKTGDNVVEEETEVEETEPEVTKEKKEEPKKKEEVVKEVKEPTEVKEEKKEEVAEVKPEEKVEEKKEPVEEEKEEEKKEEVTIVTPKEEVKKPKEPVLNIEDWITPQKAAALLILREKKEND